MDTDYPFPPRDRLVNLVLCRAIKVEINYQDLSATGTSSSLAAFLNAMVKSLLSR